MGMYQLLGEVINVFAVPEKTNTKSGEITPASLKVQVMGEDELENGEVKLALVDLNIKDPAVWSMYKSLKGKRILQPIGIMVNFVEKKQVTYALKGSKPQVMKDAAAA